MHGEHKRRRHGLVGRTRQGAYWSVQFIGWLLATCLTVGLISQAVASESNLVTVDFENVDLRIFIKFVSEATGRVFLLDERVRGQVSVRFANKIPIDQLTGVLASVLEVKGFAVIPAGSVSKIVPLNSAKQRGLEVTGHGAPVAGGRR